MDRNREPTTRRHDKDESLSARRAWIEIKTRSQPSKPRTSLSARRAWIEIAYGALDGASEIVALRKESVDRNNFPAG